MPAECTRFMLNLMNRWKLGFAVCVPALGLSAVLIYYIIVNDSTDNDSSQPPNELDEAQRQAEEEEEAAREKNKLFGYINLGNRSLETGCYEDAVEYYTKYLSMCPQSDRVLIAHVFLSRATTYYNMKLLQKCLADCGKVLELLPLNKHTLFLRAKVLIKMKNFKLAAEDVTVYLLTKDNEQSIEDVSFAFYVIITFDKETIKEFQNTKNAIVLIIEQIKQTINYTESFLDETLNAVDPKVLDKGLFKTNMITSIQFLKNCMDKYSAGTARSNLLDVIKLKNSIDLRLEAARRIKLIHETNETIQ